MWLRQRCHYKNKLINFQFISVYTVCMYNYRNEPVKGNRKCLLLNTISKTVT